MALDPALNTELQKLVVTMFGCIEIVLPHATVRLIDGAGFVTFSGRTFTGLDPVYGTIDSIDTFADGVDDEDPTLSITMLPPSNTGAAMLADPTAQGGQVSLWVGAINPITGLPVATPELRFLGEIDVPTLVLDRGTRKLKLEVVSVFERFFSDDEGVRLTDAWHQSIWPGETGLAAITTVQRKLPWGGTAPLPSASVSSVVTGGGGSYGGFTGGRASPCDPPVCAPRRRRSGDAGSLPRSAPDMGKHGLCADRRLLPA